MNKSNNSRKCFKVESNINTANSLIKGYGCAVIGHLNAGLVATEKILAGTMIFVEKSMLTCNLNTGEGIKEAKHILNSNNFYKQKAELDSINPYTNTMTSTSNSDITNNNNNNFRQKKSFTKRLKMLLKQCGTKIKSNGNYLIFQLYTITRHSCVPNIQMTLYGDNVMVAHALKDIPRGHELTHSRIALNLTHLERQHLFVNRFHKPCYCWHCHFCENDAKFCYSDDNYRSIISSLSKNLIISNNKDEDEEELKKQILHLLNLTTVCEVGYMDEDYHCYSDIKLLKRTHVCLSKLYLNSGDETSSMKHLRLAHGYSLLASGQNSEETEALFRVISNHHEEHISLLELPIFYNINNNKKNAKTNEERILKRKNLLLEEQPWRNKSEQAHSRKLDFSVELPVISRPPSYKDKDGMGVDFEKSLGEFSFDGSQNSLKVDSIINMDEEIKKKLESIPKKAESTQFVQFVPKQVTLEAPIGSPKSTWTSLVAEKKQNHWKPPKSTSDWARSQQKNSSPDKYTLVGKNLAHLIADLRFKSPDKNDKNDKNNIQQQNDNNSLSQEDNALKPILPNIGPKGKANNNNPSIVVDIPKSRDRGPSNIRIDERGGIYDVRTTTSIDLGNDEESIEIN